MAQVRVRWIDAPTPSIGNKILRNDVEITDIGLGVQEYIDANAPDGETPKYEVQSYDAEGNETTQEVLGENMDYITTPPIVIAPDAPTSLAVGTPTSITIPLTWSQSASGAMTNYRVYIGGVLQQTFGDVAAGTLTGLTAETTYNNITVRAWDGVLESADSNSVNATTEAAPLGTGTYNFDGTSTSFINTYVGDGGFDPVVLTGDFTWVFRGIVASGIGTRMSLMSGYTNTYFSFQVDTGDRFRIDLAGGGGDILRHVPNADHNISDGVLHTTVVTYEVATGALRTYLDGVESDNYTGNTYTGQTQSTAFLQIGSKGNTVNLNGSIDVVQCYSEVLDAAAVLALETDINGYASGKVLDYNSNKTALLWTDDANGRNSTEIGSSVTYTP